MITIIDYKMGNLGSIANMFQRLGIDAVVSSTPQDIASASKLILPGVGAFDNGMKNLNQLNIREILEKKVFDDKIPFLGICLGMQLLTEKSEEGTEQGLGWIEGKTIRFSNSFNGAKLRIPHMGWNELHIIKSNVLFKNFASDPRFYFVHGYHVHCTMLDDVTATTSYGIEFHSSVQKGNIFGVQFHPEKSHKFGMTLLKNFAEYQS
jgi:imidazole glycerol-phosphate synthase subunit HisH